MGPYNSSPLDICTLFSHHTVSSMSMQTMILIRNDDLIRTVPPTPTLSTLSTLEWGNCFPNNALFLPSHLNMKCLLLFPLSTHVAYVLPASFLVYTTIHGLLDPFTYWCISEKEAWSSDLRVLWSVWDCVFYFFPFLKVAINFFFRAGCVKKGTELLKRLLHTVPRSAQEKGGMWTQLL